MNLLRDYQQLVGILVTLVAAFIRFSGVIYSQRSIARLARRQTETKSKRELKSFQNAMVGELSALQQSIKNSVELLDAQIAMAEEIAKKSPGKKMPPRTVFQFATPVFDSHVSQIGLLPPRTVIPSVCFYGRLKSYALRCSGRRARSGSRPSCSSDAIGR